MREDAKKTNITKYTEYYCWHVSVDVNGVEKEFSSVGTHHKETKQNFALIVCTFIEAHHSLSERPIYKNPHKSKSNEQFSSSKFRDAGYFLV